MVYWVVASLLILIYHCIASPCCPSIDSEFLHIFSHATLPERGWQVDWQTWSGGTRGILITGRLQKRVIRPPWRWCRERFSPAIWRGLLFNTTKYFTQICLGNSCVVNCSGIICNVVNCRIIICTVIICTVINCIVIICTVVNCSGISCTVVNWSGIICTVVN